MIDQLWRSACLMCAIVTLTGCQAGEVDPKLTLDTAPDLIIINADTYTVDDTQPRVEAFAVRQGRFSATGSTAEMRALAGQATEIIDAGGRTIVPGFIDGHAHISGTAPVVAGVDLAYVVEKDEWLRLIAEADARLPEGEWLRGGYWDHTLSDGVYPNRAMLDSVVPDRPVLLAHIDGHYSWANSLALEMAGVTKDSPVPAGGEIVIDPQTGEPSGILLEGAQGLVREIIPEMADAIRRAGLVEMQAYANRFGITSIHQMGRLEDYLHIVETGTPRLRVWYGTWLRGGIEGGVETDIDGVLQTQADLVRRVEAQGHAETLGPVLELGFVKLMNDGVLSAHTAALSDDYSDRPGWRGAYITSPEELAEQVRGLNAAGLPVAIHSIGDAAVAASLDALAGAAAYQLAVPNRIEHIELLHIEDIDRFKSLGIVASMQPNHATNALAYVPSRIGTERGARAYTWRAFHQAGVPLVFGSDYPTSPLSPLVQMADAMFRTSPFGLNDGAPWHPEQTVSFEDALEAYTRTGADITAWRDEIGSISAGKWADFVILSGAVPEPMDKRFRDLEVDQTYLAGRKVYARVGEQAR